MISAMASFFKNLSKKLHLKKYTTYILMYFIVRAPIAYTLIHGINYKIITLHK